MPIALLLVGCLGLVATSSATSLGLSFKSDFKLRQYEQPETCTNRTERLAGSIGVCYEVDGLDPPFVQFHQCDTRTAVYSTSNNSACANGTLVTTSTGECLNGVRVDCPFAASNGVSRATVDGSLTYMLLLLSGLGLVVRG